MKERHEQAQKKKKTREIEKNLPSQNHPQGGVRNIGTFGWFAGSSFDYQRQKGQISTVHKKK